MDKINIYETKAERERRNVNRMIREEYLFHSHVILSGKYRPNRILSLLAEKHGKSVMGIKHILKQAGIYRDAKHPVVLSGDVKPQQAVLGF